MEQKLKLMLGELMFQNAALQTQIEQLKARVAELEPKAPEPVTKK